MKPFLVGLALTLFFFGCAPGHVLVKNCKADHLTLDGSLVQSCEKVE